MLSQLERMGEKWEASLERMEGKMVARQERMEERTTTSLEKMEERTTTRLEKMNSSIDVLKVFAIVAVVATVSREDYIKAFLGRIFAGLF